MTNVTPILEGVLEWEKDAFQKLNLRNEGHLFKTKKSVVTCYAISILLQKDAENSCNGTCKRRLCFREMERKNH